MTSGGEGFVKVFFRQTVSMAALLALPSAALAAEPSASDFDRAGAEGAATLVLGELARSVVEGEASAGALRDRMLADPAAYRERDGARASLKDFFADNARRRYAEEAKAVLERLARPRRAADVFDAGFADGAVELATYARSDALEGAYPAAFERARAEACANQAQRFVAAVRPGEAEVDSSTPEKLRETLTARIAAGQDRPVFEENLGYISEKLAGPLVDEAFSQLKSQRASVEHARPEGAAPSALAGRLAGHVATFVASRRAASGGGHVYGIFPSVTNELVFSAAEKLARSRIGDALEKVDFPCDAEAVEKAILADLQGHARREDSIARLTPAAEGSLAAAAADAFVSAAPPEEREEASAFAKGALRRDPLASRAAAIVRGRLVPVLDGVRATLAAKRFAEACPSFADGTWFPDGAAVDSLCAKPDWKGTLAGWMKCAELAAAAPELAAGVELEETIAKADRFVAAALERARSARAVQLSEVDAEAVKAKEKFAAEAREGRKPKFEEVKGFLAGAVRAAWDAAREETLWKDAGKRPSNAALHHAALFPSVERRIEEKAKEIVASIEEPEPPKPEEPAPSESV